MMQNSSPSLPKENEKVLEVLGSVVSAYLSNPGNAIPSSSIADVIHSVYATITNLDKSTQKKNIKQAPVPIEESVTPGYIICLEDGKKLKMLKRHLRTSYGLTPDSYRERWGLPVDYPMVAPDYAEKRSRLATQNGLGKTRARAYRRPASAVG
ncbi:MucR family transcriptional regulator [Candidatus Hydrogenosomobacter endosymbioticus]|uniref:MucR family transcriptional regulator n=1 Tax=Candidatus Hydrogenosomobacter endosymbioticus TaxID=2558174 RepID=A0ABN6L357_9PROT|nr:MucR family transcriptional regulator [Candidatus Hydrogenosomobacter endosymbioticus]BDB95982.1 MucR family transcriptional regulator [Candidatus Hydrogenosomobacter endosymbioticus]